MLRCKLTVGNYDASDEEIRNVCKIAKLTEFLERLPRGLETPPGDDSVRSSRNSGNRSPLHGRCSKTLTSSPSTSDLDTNLEQRVHRGIETIDCDRGLFVIVHRLLMMNGADKIYVILNSRILEIGTHEDLLDRGDVLRPLIKSRPRPNRHQSVWQFPFAK